MLIDDAFPSRFLRHSDLRGREQRMTIADVTTELIGDRRKLLVSFTNTPKSLVANKTNATAIARVFGRDTDHWRGKSITLYPTQVDFKGDTVDAIRVRAAPPPTAPADEDPFAALDDDPDYEL
jgi:hypothetical protein